MAKKSSSGQRFSATSIVALVLVIMAAGLIVLLVYQELNKPKTQPQAPPSATNQPEQPAIDAQTLQEQEPVVIDYNKVDGKGEEDQAMASLMEERKAKYGVGESLDLIVNENESIKVGEYTVSMKQIMDDVKVSRGEIVVDEIRPKNQDSHEDTNQIDGQENLAQSEDAVQAGLSGGDSAKSTARKKGASEFGVYVVQPGDNIWNIHFRLLDEFFAHQGVRLSPLADEPSNQGFSSGVGKILKFSENMVAIYNLKTRQVDQDLNLIQPLSKVVVYNMTHVFDLLRQIDYSQVNMIQFDGDTLWLPVKE